MSQKIESKETGKEARARERVNALLYFRSLALLLHQHHDLLYCMSALCWIQGS